MATDTAHETISGFLDRLADRTATPGGGAVAALAAAHAAALVAMAARFTDDPSAPAVAAAADRLRERAVSLADDDQTAFTAVSAAYSLPRATEQERERRTTAVRDAMAGASEPPAGVVTVAAELVALAERLLPVVNATLVADLAAAADAAHAAASTGRLNVDANLRGRADHPLRAGMPDVDDLLQRAVDLRESVRKGFHA
ncbi:MAG TPA: cyclodeaminase/cyclohydrolase family protein [Marmoricola sp.]|nr:cyclodeaminase/cyclohydrolase family protein [Marmoricola sp.]